MSLAGVLMGAQEVRIVSDSLCKSDIFERGPTMQRGIIHALTPDRMGGKCAKSNNSCMNLQKTADFSPLSTASSEKQCFRMFRDLRIKASKRHSSLLEAWSLTGQGYQASL